MVALKDIPDALLDVVLLLCDARMHAVLDSGVHAAPAEDAADSQLPHGLYNAVVQPFPLMGIHVIQVGGDTAVGAFHQAQHGAVVAVIGSQVGGCREGHGFQPVL